EVKPNGKVAIVSGGKMTKAYVIARQLKAQGCRVVLLETSKYWMVASRASNCVDRFAMVPLPEKDLAGYLDAVRALAIEEKADLFIPVTSPAASEYEAQVAPVLPAGCVSWSLDLETVRDLDDKTAFCSSAERLGLPAPRSHRVASDEEAHAFNEKLLAEAATATAGAETRYILKSLAYDSMHRLDLFTLPCAPDNPWIIQTFVVGDEYSTCALVKEGRLLAFTDNRACLSCFNYTPARSEALRSWVRDFCAARRLSGVVCIDFIVDAQSGTPYAIECNPRFSSNVLNLFWNPPFGGALFRPHKGGGVEAFFWPPPPPPPLQIWALLSKRPFSLRSAGALLSTVATKKDAYFDVADPLPFIAHLFVHIPALLARNLSTGNKWAKIDPCIGKLTEENGD
ncbi:hypothetical protein EMIHUDRAFT_52960, partial [Emiliania huxleyi CCMP1516]|uniref:ATP-grasp fold PylC-type domain-containing protein n=2 Tax=Emiliania huxleyi TaxID=2903 RepID=A0A0D3KYN9_EMIH1